jgi:uncharacterized protein YlxW (UPF0749 family)
MPTLTRNEMEAIIKSGGGVLLNGTIHTSIATLPSKAELAAGDPVAEQEAQSELRAQIADLQKQLEAAQASQEGEKTKKRIASLQTKLESTTDPAVQEKIQAQIAELEAKLGNA